jgi:hypothetical protein
MKNRLTPLSMLVLALAMQPGFAYGHSVKGSDSQSTARKTMTKTSNASNPKNDDSEAPFACSMTALSAAERAHHKDLSAELHAAVKEIRELPNGYAFRLSGERRSLAMLSEWVSLERLCCPFFTFQIEAASETQPVWLRITGREGVKVFMQSEFGIK